MRCECGANDFVATESWYLSGNFEEKILFLEPTGDGGGIEKIKCAECGKELEGDFEIEIL